MEGWVDGQGVGGEGLRDEGQGGSEGGELGGVERAAAGIRGEWRKGKGLGLRLVLIEVGKCRWSWVCE
jgi:hypothetical protein